MPTISMLKKFFNILIVKMQLNIFNLKVSVNFPFIYCCLIGKTLYLCKWTISLLYMPLLDEFFHGIMQGSLRRAE